MDSFDVAIVGGGIIGTSIAFELASVNFRVVVLDCQEPGLESSWAAAGMLSPGPDAPSALPLVPLAKQSLRRYPEFVAAIERASGKSTGLARPGTLEIFTGPNAEQNRDRMLAQYRSLEIPIESLSADAARRLEPSVGPEVRAAALLGEEATIEPRALISAAIGACRNQGVTFATGIAVRSLLCDGNRSTGVLAGNEKIVARFVVLAAGSFCGTLTENHGAPNSYSFAQFAPTHPVRGQMLALRSPNLKIARVIRSENAYVVPRADGRLVAGSTLEHVGFQKAVTAEGKQRILTGVAQMVPALASAEIVESWCGLRPGTPDNLPIIGPTEIEGLLVATGHYRNGILLAPATADIVRDLIATGKTNFNIAPFSPERFSALQKEATAWRGA
jgi:glycine oxidase